MKPFFCEYNNVDMDFEFNAGNNTDINFIVGDDIVTIRIDEHSRNWDDPGIASINIPKEFWKEFVERINKIKFE